MEDICGDVGDSDGHEGGPWDLKDMLRTSGSHGRIVISNLLLFLAIFFHYTLLMTLDREVAALSALPSLQARRMLLSTPPATRPRWMPGTHNTQETELRLLASLTTALF